MSLRKLLLQDDVKKPNIKLKNGNTIITLSHNRRVFDADLLEDLRKEINYIYENQNELISNRNSTVRIILDTTYFKDRTVILMLELLIYCLCLEGDFNIYFNLRIKDKKSIAYNFYCFSFLRGINRELITNHIYCSMYESFHGRIYGKEEIIGENLREIIDTSKYDDVKQQIDMQQSLSNDIFLTLKSVINNEDILEDACEIVDELVDNILSHTTGLGLVDVAAVKVSSTEDDDDYIHIMINVLNISNNFLFTKIKDAYI